MIPSRAVLKSVPCRGFTSYSVNGFTGAVGNTPLVRQFFPLLWGSSYLSPVDVDLPENPFGEDRLENIWQGGIPKPWWEREGSSRPGHYRGSGG
jgi:hypothetical protein